jgi:hypothetical protein
MSELEQMLNELEAHRLEVQLAPSKRSDRREMDMIRVVVDYPPKWYRAFCNRHISSREIRRGKFDTKIKRANVLALLSRLIVHGKSPSKYAEEILRVARQREKKSA